MMGHRTRLVRTDFIGRRLGDLALPKAKGPSVRIPRQRSRPMIPTDIIFIFFAQFVDFLFAVLLGILQAILQAPV